MDFHANSYFSKYCSIVDERSECYQANYKQWVEEQVRGAAETKDKGMLRDKDELTVSIS